MAQSGLWRWTAPPGNDKSHLHFASSTHLPRKPALGARLLNKQRGDICFPGIACRPDWHVERASVERLHLVRLRRGAAASISGTAPSITAHLSPRHAGLGCSLYTGGSEAERFHALRLGLVPSDGCLDLLGDAGDERHVFSSAEQREPGDYEKHTALQMWICGAVK
ncbi:hypothetical protein EYF80_028005 [Liparis tanakae]|uniref:Uncharacterized protein n=1 Tax=Liparis tanakae TaxID=230148 RepID=A0A4Z2H9S9_9TELE|nr:hypothetical protein EYF80_028005 [Liparis tanakae]